MHSNERTDPTARLAPRQLLVLGVCAVGLMVASFAMPATAPSPGPLSLDFLNQESDCTILLSEEPVPGRDVTATIRYDEEPVRDSRVWFNGRAVGRTDRNGRVTGTVPYQKQLRIRVELPSGGQCRAGSVTGGGEVSRPDALARAGAGPGLAEVGPVQAQQGANGSGEYPVRGRIDIAVARQPYPGETTTIRATILGSPVPDATVTVDGEQVGRTDADGLATIRAPEQGDGTLRVEVERGEFRSVRRVVVNRLAVDVRAAFPALPGQRGTVAATIGADPAEDVAVTIGGQSVGTTDEDGTVGVRLPADPTARVAVETANQTASVPVAVAYLPTALFALLFVVVTAGIPVAGYAYGGRRGFVAGVATVGVIYVLGIGYLLGDGTGLLAAVALVTLLVVVGSFLRSDHDVTGGTRSVGGAARRLADRLFSEALWLTGRIESLVDGLGRRAGRLGDRLRSASLADLPAWLARLPARLVAYLRGLAGAPGRLFRSADDGDDGTEPTATDEQSGPNTSPTERFRAVWRQFASRVAPGEWPRRTAGEVSRRAVERGLPPEPVEELTDTFRAVEYGDEPLTERQFERARAALAAITDEKEESA